MIPFLDHSTARSIAEANWGTGGTTSYRTNRRGCFYFSCSGHGGFVIDAAVLTPDERKLFDQHLTAEKATIYRWGSKQRVMHPYRRQRFSVPISAEIHAGAFYLAEEDCAWSIPAVHAGILAHHDRMSPEDNLRHAQECFNRWFLPSQPAPGSESATGSASS